MLRLTSYSEHVSNQSTDSEGNREEKKPDTRNRQIEMFLTECIIKCSKSYNDITLCILCNVIAILIQDTSMKHKK